MSAALELEAARALLTLREILVRHDENEKAWTLMSQCVPYIVQERRDVRQALHDQHRMVEHLLDPVVMAAYYAANPHDRSFEEQHDLQAPGAALDKIPRCGLLRDRLAKDARVLDLACNDGILAAALRGRGHHIRVDGVDLGVDCIARAKARGLPGNFVCCDLHDAHEKIPATYSDVVLFEVIEHTVDPAATLVAAAQFVEPGGRLWVSTPIGAVERGELPTWDVVEHKGHVRAYTPEAFAREFDEIATEVELIGLPDGTMVARATIGTPTTPRTEVLAA